MIELNNLSTGYGKRIVSCDLSASLLEGELVALLGPNGVGKSTLLRTLSAFLLPLNGRIAINGRDLKSYSTSELSTHIGIVLTERPSVGEMTVGEMVAMGRSPHTNFWGSLRDEDERLIDDALQMVGIAAMKQRLFGTLSDGERQKTMIAKVIAQQTPVILLDEPTAFLDFPSKVDILLLLRRLAHEQSKIVFLSTHDVEMAMRIADKLWLLDNNGLITGTPNQLDGSGALARFFNSETVTYRSGQLYLHGAMVAACDGSVDAGAFETGN